VRIAAIDIGTNSIHMVIADATVGEAFAVLDREREVVQVGRGSFHDGRLRGDAMRGTAAALRRFVLLARRHAVDRILCTATAAVREARNGGDFLRLARHESGISPRVIPNEEEGRLIHLAVQAALQLDSRPALIVDIGGGSAQLVHVRGSELLRVVGVPLGALRLTETRFEHDPPSERELETLRRHVRKQLRAALETLGEPAPEVVYGSSGSIHALAGLTHWAEHGRGLAQINGHVLELSALAELTRRLERMPHEERQALPGIDAARAEIIVPGAIVLEQVLRLADARSITLSDYGVREGLVTDWIKRHAQELSTLEAAGDLRMRSVLGLLARFDADGGHARHVAALSLRLFDELERWHKLEAREREWLHFAALLHDLGSAVAYDGHAQHSAYIIRNGGLRGLTAEEIDIVASIARHHGGSRPRRKRDEVFAALPKRARRAVRWLSAMLRVAEGLDRSHYQLVRELHLRQRGDTLVIVADAGRHAQLELWAGRRRAMGLARLVGQAVTVMPAVSERAVLKTARHGAGEAPPPPRDAAPRAVARGGDPAAQTSARTRSAARDRSAVPARVASGATPPPAPPRAPGEPRPLPRRAHPRKLLVLPRRSASA
jgi:exopolyphosphatase / guanosine-5'-triphosphate,3'-diphosphate pyrophosphatase